MNDSGGFTVLDAGSWLTEGLDLMRGAVVGSLDSVVGYETDGCARRLEGGGEGVGRVVPTGEDGAASIPSNAPAAWSGLQSEDAGCAAAQARRWTS